MGLNTLLNQELFSIYEEIDTGLKNVQSSQEDFGIKKDQIKKLKDKFTPQMNSHKTIMSEFSNEFLRRNNLNDYIISARIGSPTPYGYQPKNYLWSGISIDEDKSFSFQYSWVFQKDLVEITFCFGSGGSSSGTITKEKRSEKEEHLNMRGKALLDALSESKNVSIIKDLISIEGFIITSNWLQNDERGSKDVEVLIEYLKSNNVAKCGITRYFTKEQILDENINLEKKIYHYFEMFSPIWESIKKNVKKSEPIDHKIKTNHEKEIRHYSSANLIKHIKKYINAKGFYFTKEDVINLFLSLKTKPFVILSGISGTGKTKIVQLFAESLGAMTDNGQFALIPVRPDWSDGSDLIGYRDIKGEFQAGPLTKILMEANKPENSDKPYFLLLDEMNLARVEYYFSDLLSVMESRDRQDGEMVSAPVVEEEEVGRLLLRDNFYIIGTVNMDETTHPFSPKVLDRANTIEYNDVVLDHFGFLIKDSIAEPVAIDNQLLAGRFLNLKDAFFDHEELVRKVTGLLVEVNTLLEPIKAHFGYRVRDEICFYMIYNNEGQLMEFDDAFDYQLVQKVLPRLTGNDLKTEEALKKLFLFCTSHEWDEMNATSIVKEARFSKSAEKLSNMIPKIMHDGFTSFWGS
ncbi:MAG: McrB family protein [Bacillota bacterium]